METIEYNKKDLPVRVKKTGWILVGTGLVLAVLSYLVDANRAAIGNLIVLMFLSSIAIGSVMLVALEYLAGAVWSTPMRRVTEFLASSLPFVVLLAIPLFLNLQNVFHWLHPEPGDHMLHSKAPYLNVVFFTVRFAVIIVVFYTFYRIFTRNSVKQDHTGEQKLTQMNVKLSAVFMPLAAILLSVLAIDWIMSIEPHWYSTIFGIYYISGTVLAGLGATTYAVVQLNENGYFQPKLNGDHLYSLGALMFAFTNFWAYIAFSQFLLIWYANIPEETYWFVMRWQGSWKYVSAGLILIRFVIPYAGLLSQPSKMDPKRLKVMSLWILFAHLFDLYWLVMPSFSESVAFSWTELGYPILVIGILILVFYFKSRKHNLMPVGDPKLKRGLEFHL
jgi:hypothetical protein